jgi:hypothetical protein
VIRCCVAAIEILILTALILAPRCANYQDVFAGGNIYFTDADCYARMTRVHLCAQHPGLIIRHHDFENYPAGTTPHTTAPLDYLILGLSILLKPLSAQPIDLAGAFISPLFALLGGWFLWWWLGQMRFSFRWTALILYAISPILVHGTELGRPDHQSLLVLMVTIGVCAEWSLVSTKSTGWGVVSGTSWGLAIWVSVYEPLVLLVLLLACRAVGPSSPRRVFDRTGSKRRRVLRPIVTPHSGLATAKSRRIGWIVFLAIVAVALAIEQRLPSLSLFRSDALLRNWSHTIGELASVSPLNPIWFRWAGYMVVIAPILIWFGCRTRIRLPLFIILLLVATFGLTTWQARWSYFFVSIFVIALPRLLEPIKLRSVVWLAFFLSILPVLRDWDERLWPNESVLAARIEQRNESAQLRELALTIRSSEIHPFLAPWWLCPEIAFWSDQPGVAGSSHESLDGIADTARFLLAQNEDEAREILNKHKVNWVFAYDSDRTEISSAAILGTPAREHPLCRMIDRTPARAPSFLIFSGQNPAAKMFRVVNSP